MRDFEEMLDDGRIRNVSRDKAQADGMLERAVRRIENQKSRKINGKNAFEVLENSYEAVREAIEGEMARQGYRAEDHVAVAAFAASNLGLSDSDINRFHRFRKLRNQSRYEAKEIEEREAHQAIEYAEETLEDIRGKKQQ
jgi:hypothetical protein